MPVVDVNDQLKRSTLQIQGLENLLTNFVLPDLIGESGFPAGAKILVNCRLNQTGHDEPAPIWCAWVEQPPSGFNPIGGNHGSPVYSEAYGDPANHKKRKYPDQHDQEKKPDPTPGHQRDPFDQDANALHFNWRRYVCIKAKNRKVGTLTVGFQNPPQPPQNEAKVETTLKHWAKGTAGKTALVAFLEANFILGGAIHP